MLLDTLVHIEILDVAGHIEILDVAGHIETLDVAGRSHPMASVALSTWFYNFLIY